MALQLAKLFSRINFNGPLATTRPELGPCWIWLGSTDKDGYGRITFDGKTRRVHRVTYALVKGNIPEESEPDHLCRVRACGNPIHLELVSSHENLLRSNCPAALNARKNHCPQGHALVPGNLIASELKRGHRPCLTCRRTNSHRHQAKKYPNGLMPSLSDIAVTRNHKRWHVNRGISNPNCDLCQANDAQRKELAVQP
jgi:HNH endonuclease